MNPQTQNPFDPSKRPGDPGSTQNRLSAPPIVLALVAIMTVAYLYFLLAPPAMESRTEFWLTLWPRRVLSGAAAPGGWAGALVPLISHMFVHTEFIHLLANAGFLLAFGTPVAERIGVGVRFADQRNANLRFLAFFLLSGVAGAALFIALHPDDLVFARGASGGVSGLLGAATRFALFPPAERREDPWRIARLFDRRVVSISAFYIVFNAAITFIPMFGMSIAGEAHIGGYLFGLAAFPAFALGRPAAR